MTSRHREENHLQLLAPRRSGGGGGGGDGLNRQEEGGNQRCIPVVKPFLPLLVGALQSLLKLPINELAESAYCSFLGCPVIDASLASMLTLMLMKNNSEKNSSDTKHQQKQIPQPVTHIEICIPITFAPSSAPSTSASTSASRIITKGNMTSSLLTPPTHRHNSNSSASASVSASASASTASTDFVCHMKRVRGTKKATHRMCHLASHT